MMKRIAFLLLFSTLLAINSNAQEVITSYENNTLPVINEQLRRYTQRISTLENGIPLTSGVTGILPLANGGTGVALVDPDVDATLYWDDSAGAVTWNPVTSSDNFELFTSDGTFTAPDNITIVYVTMVGGGAGGDDSNGDPGGGGGASKISVPYLVTGGNSYNVVVGEGGASGNPGSNGENSSFDSFIVADGGNGDGTGGFDSGDASSSTAGTLASISGGDGASYAGGGTAFGKGGQQASSGAGTAIQPTANRGGGGQGGNPHSGAGNGADGFVLVQW